MSIAPGLTYSPLLGALLSRAVLCSPEQSTFEGRQGGERQGHFPETECFRQIGVTNRCIKVLILPRGTPRSNSSPQSEEKETLEASIETKLSP